MAPVAAIGCVAAVTAGGSVSISSDFSSSSRVQKSRPVGVRTISAPTHKPIAVSLGFSHSHLLNCVRLRQQWELRMEADGSRNVQHGPMQSSLVVSCSSDGERTPPTSDSGPLVKLAWYGSEAFGNLVSLFRPASSSTAQEDEEGEEFQGPISRKDAVDAIRKDYDRSYFVTGNMAMGIYEPNCEFADPFVSFKGLKRFKQNVSNLGSFMEESSLKVTDWQEFEDRIYARWRFNCVLALPWRPILAATGSTEYYFDTASGRICKHVENWDISPLDGLRQLVKPNPKGRKENRQP
ncbi:unnamed protein product [Sphagnum jensenii]|uniref:Uncharacterized protein n=1 Tax=Sphagnum jensenii TaxID=128206 RepID=A0ABP0X2W9_9BRYO